MTASKPRCAEGLFVPGVLVEFLQPEELGLTMTALLPTKGRPAMEATF